MKLLYLSPVGKKIQLRDPSTVEGHTLIDLDTVRRQLVSSLVAAFPDDTIEEASNVFEKSVMNFNPSAVLEYDVFVCDVSSTHATIMFGAGLGEALGKPIVYIINGESPVSQLLANRQLMVYSLPSISQQFLDDLRDKVRFARDNPTGFIRTPSKKEARKAFVCYCHSDRAYLDRLMVHLKPLAKSGDLDIWVDTRLKTGDKWKETIESAIGSARIAILLISADFLASDFIVNHELPPLLAKAQVNGTRIVPILVSPSRFTREASLNVYQAINSPSVPLSLMKYDEREVVYDKVAQEFESALHSWADTSAE